MTSVGRRVQVLEAPTRGKQGKLNGNTPSSFLLSVAVCPCLKLLLVPLKKITVLLDQSFPTPRPHHRSS